MAQEFCLKLPDFHVTFRDLLYAVNLLHGTNGFTSLPKEGVLRTFSPLKIGRLRPGLNPRTSVPRVSTLPLDHRSRFVSGGTDASSSLAGWIKPLGIQERNNKKHEAIQHLFIPVVSRESWYIKNTTHTPHLPVIVMGTWYTHTGYITKEGAKCLQAKLSGSFKQDGGCFSPLTFSVN